MSHDAHVLQEWKHSMTTLLKMKYGKKFSKNDCEKMLDKVIDKRLINPNVSVFNNYSNVSVRTNVLDLTDSIKNSGLIITGGGCLFMPHGTKANILIDFIETIMAKRKAAKKERSKYEKNSNDWLVWEIAQNLNKLVINSLYGCMGYPGFLLYNVFTAEAITNEGRHIITTAINAIEGFLGDAMYLVTEEEAFHFLYTIHTEYTERYNKNIDLMKFPRYNWLDLAYQRVLSRCTFAYDQSFKDIVFDMLKDLDDGELALLYYKNNLLEFSKNQFIIDKLKYVIENNGVLSFCEMHLLKTPEIQKVVQDIWDLYEVFVLYDYPINDRLRKAMYLPKSRCLYTDTDSVFMSLFHFVAFIRDDVYHQKNPMNTADDLRFTSVNLALIFVNNAIDKSMKTLCSSTNIEPEYAKKLGMKNEFYLKRILFVPKKKRYISLSVLQEGQLLGGGRGLPEIKGFDFKKSTTKPYLRDFYTDLANDEILFANEISPARIFTKMCKLKDEIEYGVTHGDTKFFKQSKVKRVEDYKNPYSTQGINSVLLWNTLCPHAQIELPGDVNIVPIKGLTCPKPPVDKNPRFNKAVQIGDPLKNKEIAKFAEKYPDVYNRLEREIYQNPNATIRYMSLNSIAFPKNTNIEIPDYVYYLIKYDDIVNNALMLFLPVMDAIGLKSLPSTTAAKADKMSNIVSL